LHDALPISALAGKAFKEQAGTGEPGFGFLKLRDVERRDAKIQRADASARFRKRRGENDRAAESQRVGGMRFRGIHVNPVVAPKRCSVEPGAVGEQCVVAKKGNGGFEVQAAGHRDGDNFVAVGLDDLRELADTFRVAAFGESHKKLAADAKNVPAFERSGKLDVGEFAVLRKLLREQMGFAAAALRAQWQNDREFIEHDSGIFDEHRVGEMGLGGKRDDTGSQFGEEHFIGLMLLPRAGQVNRLAVNKRKLAMDDGWTDGSSNGCKHDEGAVYTRIPHGFACCSQWRVKSNTPALFISNAPWKWRV